jgi:hypothetical protein
VPSKDSEVLDFSNVKDAPSIKPRRLPEGDYLFKIVKYESTITQEKKNKMWTFILVPEKHKSASYPYRCILTENSLWKLRNLLIACGMTVPKKSVRVDPEKLIGKACGGTLEDSEYNDREQSDVTAVFPADDLDDDGPEGGGDDVDAADDEDVTDDELDEIEVDDI